MNKLLVSAIVVVGVLIGAPAHAWVKYCQTAGTDETNLSLKPGEYACFNSLLTSTTDSGYLNVSSCENIDVFFNSIITAATTNNTARILNCFDPGTLDANMCNVIENLTLDGDAATSTEAIYGASAVWVYVDMVLHGTSGTTRTIIKCNGPTGS